MSLIIYWPQNGHQWCRQCTVHRMKVVINTKRYYISAECDTKCHSPKNYYFKPNPVPIQFHELISNQKALGLFPSTKTQNNLELILFWRNRLPPSSEHILRMQTVIYAETLLHTSRYPNPHHIIFIQHCKKTEAKNTVDGSCKKNWITSTTLCSEPTLHDVMLLHFAPYLSYSFYCLVKWNNKVNGYNKTKSCKPFRNEKCYEF
jgi:hypothetical protein